MADVAQPPSHWVVRAAFLRVLALTYLVAFLSLTPQIKGLIGSRGITPAAALLDSVKAKFGASGFWLYPTLLWLNSSDTFLVTLCWAGVVLALVAVLKARAVWFALLYALYLSLVIGGQEFLSFQWDALLLETGFLAILFAGRGAPSGAVVWLLRFLLFRLMFASGWVKLASGDPTWHNLTALLYHYETQPLPTPEAWHMQKLPAWFQVFSARIMFAIELVVPFFIFAPRRLRFCAAGPIIFLQAIIALTGNYAFFNILTIALCLTLLDDAALGRVEVRPVPAASSARRTIAVILGLAAVIQFTEQLPFGGAIPAAVREVPNWLSRWQVVNTYGLFAVMTTVRHEIIVQGSPDGQNWLDYDFKFKPGDVRRMPSWVAPHQPRLDWQMWFAALGSYQQNPWFLGFAQRLLEGGPEVLGLLAHNPFPGAPPRYVRAIVYDYHFTDRAARRKDGAWWKRELLGPYCPVLSLRQ